MSVLGTTSGSGGRFVYPLTDLPWPRAKQVFSTNATQLITSQACVLVGWTIRETTGAANAAVDLYNGSDDKGEVYAAMATINAFGQVAGPGWPGIPFPDGMFAKIITGAFVASVWYIPAPGGGL